jgi:hypothetical protein
MAVAAISLQNLAKQKVMCTSELVISVVSYIEVCVQSHVSTAELAAQYIQLACSDGVVTVLKAR